MKNFNKPLLALALSLCWLSLTAQTGEHHLDYGFKNHGSHIINAHPSAPNGGVVIVSTIVDGTTEVIQITYVDDNQTPVWSHRYEFGIYTDEIVRALNIKETGNGGVDGYILTGYLQNGLDPKDLLVFKIDLSGNIVFSNIYNDPLVEQLIVGMDIIPHQNGLGYIGVGFISELPLTQDAQKEIILFSVDNNGNFSWLQRYDSPSGSSADFDMANTIVPIPIGYGHDLPSYFITGSKNVNVSGSFTSAVLSMRIDEVGTFLWENSFKNIADPDYYDVGASAFFCHDMEKIYHLSNSTRYPAPIITEIDPTTGALIDNRVINSDIEPVAGYQIINDPFNDQIILMARVQSLDFTRMGIFYPNNYPVRVIRLDKSSLTHVEQRTLFIPSTDYWDDYDGFLENMLYSHFPVIYTPNIGAYNISFDEIRVVTESFGVTPSGLRFDLAYLYLDYHLDGACWSMENVVVENNITQPAYPGIGYYFYPLTENLNLSRPPLTPDLYDCEGNQFANKKKAEEVEIAPHGELSITLSPNPTSGIVAFSINSQEPVDFKFAIYDLNGRVVFERSGHDTGNHPEAIDLSKLPKGLYIITFTTYDQMIRERLVIQ